jgi:putative lipoprotein
MHMLSAPAALEARLPAEHGVDDRARPAPARVRLPRRLALAGALALVVAACGRKGSPEPPPGIPKEAFPKQYPPKGS